MTARPCSAAATTTSSHSAPGADAGAQRGGIDLHLAAEVRLHEEGVVQGRQRGGQVARGLGRDAQAQVAGEGDGVADLGGRAGVDDAGGPQVGREVPGGAGPVVAAVDGLDDERARRGAAGGGGEGAHGGDPAATRPAPPSRALG
jgi:hypothetical protein